jgi:phosphoribosylaminoimidazole-succinocarboxamide synthase
MTHALPVEYPVDGHTPAYRGKVREIYDLGGELLIVATDRVSTYDVILPDRIEGKGKILTELSTYWFEGLADLVPTHFITSDPAELPPPFREVIGLHGRTMRVKKAERFDVECIVRGYLAGSGLKEYRRSGTVCGERLAAGLEAYAQLPEPIFTPSTKADEGHDENISFARMQSIVGVEVAETLRARSLEIYSRCAAHALARGVIIADTKFEFGRVNGEIVVIDEVLTPDSSRFWDREGYRPGHEPEPMDKQYVRNAVDATGWNHEPPAPSLAPAVIAETRRRYATAVSRITGGEHRPDWSEVPR